MYDACLFVRVVSRESTVNIEKKSLRTSNVNRPLPVPSEHCTIYETVPDDNQKTAAVNSASCNTSTPNTGKIEDDKR